MMSKRIVEVHHRQLLSGELLHVANVRTGLEDDIEALEFAWRWTNNVHGSWSRRDLAENWDDHSAVTVIAPLRTVGGQVLGHRSSMVGDIFVLDGKRFQVAAFAFDPA
jgi:hypothetical protein